MAGVNTTALQLLGKNITYRDLVLETNLPETLNTLYSGLVLAVQIPAPGLGIEYALLIREPEYSFDEYIDLDDLILVSVS
jgi:hypothetical protein